MGNKSPVNWRPHFSLKNTKETLLCEMSRMQLFEQLCIISYSPVHDNHFRTFLENIGSASTRVYFSTISPII